MSVADNDNDSANEIQTLSISGSDLSLSGGNMVTLPSATGSILFYAGLDVVANETTWLTQGKERRNDNEQHSSLVAPIDGTLTNITKAFRLKPDAQIKPAGVATCTVRINGTDTALQVTHLGSEDDGFVTSNSELTISQGDLQEGSTQIATTILRLRTKSPGQSQQ